MYLNEKLPSDAVELGTYSNYKCNISHKHLMHDKNGVEPVCKENLIVLSMNYRFLLSAIIIVISTFRRS